MIENSKDIAGSQTANTYLLAQIIIKKEIASVQSFNLHRCKRDFRFCRLVFRKEDSRSANKTVNFSTPNVTSV